jgi:hypothetical protein
VSVPLIADPPKPLRDVHLEGPLLGMVRVVGVMRVLGGVILATTYFRVWQVISGVPWTGFAMSNHSPLPVVFAGGIAALGLYLLRAPSLARGMISAAGTIVLAFLVYRVTHNTSTAPISEIQLKGAQVVFGFTFIVLVFTGFADLIFHPILYMWQRRGET